MRTLVHLSDLHFGRTDTALVEPLVAKVRDLQPDLVVVSGDLTQRARAGQFRKAREFLNRLPCPQIVVPGNHDVPLHNVFARFLSPFGNYRRHISRDLESAFLDDEIAVVGINSARSLVIQAGDIGRSQAARFAERLCAMPDSLVKVVVTHHPFDLPHPMPQRHLVGHAENALAHLVRCGADLFLAGHLHLCHTELTSRRYRLPERSAVIVQAGTGLSTRRRGESNNFNLIRTNRTEISVETFAWFRDLGSFRIWRKQSFRRSDTGWDKLAA